MRIERKKFDYAFRYYCDNCGNEYQYGEWMYKAISPEFVVTVCESCKNLLEVADRFGYDVTKREPEIAPCPGTDCLNKENMIDVTEDREYDIWQVICKRCGYRAPVQRHRSTAIRSHNAIANKHVNERE